MGQPRRVENLFHRLLSNSTGALAAVTQDILDGFGIFFKFGSPLAIRFEVLDNQFDKALLGLAIADAALAMMNWSSHPTSRWRGNQSPRSSRKSKGAAAGTSRSRIS